MADEITSRFTMAIAKLEKRIRDIEKGTRSPQLGNASLDLDSTRGYIPIKQNGVERGRIGRQPDGTVTFTSVNNPEAPQTPLLPICEPILAGVRVTCNGLPGEQPHDFSHVKVYCDGIHVGNISSLPGKYIVAPLTYVSHGFQLSAVNLSGQESEPTDFQFETPTKAVGTDITDGIIDALKIADAAITEAKIAVGAVTNTKVGPLAVDVTKLANNSVSAVKLLDDAVTADKIASAAVLADAIASNAVIAGKIAAGTITTAEIAALTIQAANIAADAIVAGKITTNAVTANTIAALAVTADKLAANSVTAGAIAAGSISAEHLAATIILASQVIIGDQNDWHLELNNSSSPILWWNNEDIGFAVSKDEISGKSNVYMSGRMEFGDGSQVDSDIIDLQEIVATGMATPKIRQSRTWIQSAPSTSITPYYLSPTMKSNCSIMCIWQVGVSGIPNCSQPSGSTLLYSFVAGTNRLTIYMIENITASRTFEVFNTGGNTCRWGIVLMEVQGTLKPTSFQVSNSNSAIGSSTITTNSITPTTTQSFQIALMGQTGGHPENSNNFGSAINGFNKQIASGSNAGFGVALYTKNATSNASSSTTVNVPTANNWMSIIASFSLATASAVPPPPESDRTIRFYTRKVNSIAAPHIMQSDGATYPIARAPYCKVTMPTDFGLTANTDVYAQSGWNPVSDYYSMAAISSTAGTFSSVTLPITGLWLLEMHTIFGGTVNTTNFGVHFMTVNARAAANSVLRDDTKFVNSTNDGSRLSTTRTIRLGAGVVLYWGQYMDVNGQVWGVRLNTSTEIGVTYLGPGA